MTKLFPEDNKVKQPGPVECLGLTFPNDEERRKYFTDKLREHLKNPEFRKIEGFPIGTDEDILKLSDPPYYTACPNPFIEDFIKCYAKPYNPETDNYRREPFAADVSEGKNDPIYNAHSYHTKVPHKAIMRYILHYTEPGDIIFDGFCGTGMTGVAAQLCGDKRGVESMGYKVLDDGAILDEEGKPFSNLGTRRAVLNDLSPAATFIAYNYNTPVDISKFEREAKRILRKIEEECGWMYETLHSDGKTKGQINYTVWSDVFICPECSKEIIFWEAAVEPKTKITLKEFQCPHCSSSVSKRILERARESYYDEAIKSIVNRVKIKPVLINYSVGKKRFQKKPDKYDYKHIKGDKNKYLICWFPTSLLPDGDKTTDPLNYGIRYVHQFYTLRNLQVIAKAFQLSASSHVHFWVCSTLPKLTIMNRYMPHHGSRALVGPMAGTLYIASLWVENNVIDQLQFQKRKILNIQYRCGKVITSTHSATTFDRLPSKSIDYAFIDPPFGDNITYSDLNYIYESWLKIFTNNKLEAIVSKAQKKSLHTYQTLMEDAFREVFRLLKPGRWATIEFHNSKNAVWNAIQEALINAGFIIADIRTLDKSKGTINQFNAAGSVKQDLIISAYKPNGGLEERFKLSAGTEAGVWDFMRTHLRQLPAFVSKEGRAEIVVERMNYLLFDRMVAFHVQRGITVPISAAEFYAGLEQRFPSRDGMYFLSEQVAEYDKKRMTVREMLQLQLFVTDESSAIQWLKQQLTRKPQTFQEIHPQFMKEIGGWQKYEKPLELLEMLEQNFLRYDGKDDVPSQIHSYLSTNFKELRNLSKNNPSLRDKAKDRWYVPDSNKAQDLEKLRERALLKDFEEYKSFTGRKLKSFRIEAVRAGFKKAWQERDYQTIISVAKKIPEKVLQEDQKLLMWYDQAVTRTGVD